MSWFGSLFSGSKTVTVSSTVYNLAGDENTRPNFLDTTVVGAVMSDSGKSIGEQLQAAYISGPGIQLRSFARWARLYGYDAAVGISATPITLPNSIDLTALTAQLPVPPSGETTVIQTSSIGPFDYTFWVDQYMVANYPTLLTTAYTCDFNEATGLVTITLVDGTVATFTISSFSPSALYLYVTYNYEVPGVTAEPAVPATLGPPPTPYIPAVAYVPVTWSPITYFAYEYASGNTSLDALFATSTDGGYFMPYIPILVNGNYISATYLPDLYAWCKKAVTRSVNAKYDDIVTKIKANPDAGSINYAYIVFGVSLNVLENQCRNYIYQFFLNIMEGLSLSSSAFATWQTAWNAAAASVTAWATWSAAQSDPSNPLYGTTAPTVLHYPTSPGYSITVAASGAPALNYHMTILWDQINETTGSGRLTKPLGDEANAGDFWFEVVTKTSIDASVIINTSVGAVPFSIPQTHIRLNWQVTLTSWRALDIYNLTHYNFIYGGKSVTTLATDALADASESGFIIPFNESLYRSLNLVTSTQMATACCFIVFNSYTVTTSPWWTSDFFKVFLIVVVIAIAISTAGIGAGGLLGTNLAVGSLFGLSGTSAIILGAVVNALAAMVLVQLIQIGANALLGPQFGAIFGAILAIFTLEIGTALSNGMSAADLLSSLIQPTNILKITEAAGNGFAQVMQQATQNIEAATQSMLQGYNVADEQVETQYQAMFGQDGGADLTVNPLSLIDTTLPNVAQSPILVQSPSDFLSRTLMTGSDIAGLSQSYIDKYCDVGTSTLLPAMSS